MPEKWGRVHSSERAGEQTCCHDEEKSGNEDPDGFQCRFSHEPAANESPDECSRNDNNEQEHVGFDHRSGKAHAVDREPHRVYEERYRNVRCNEGLRRKTAAQEKNAAEGPLMAREPAEETTQDTTDSKILPIDRKLLEPWDYFHQCERCNEDCDDNVHRRGHKDARKYLITDHGLRVRQESEESRAKVRREKGRDPEAGNHSPVDAATHEKKLKNVIEGVHHRCHADSNVWREKGDKRRKKKSAEAESGEKRETGCDKSDQGDDDKFHVS